MNDTLARIERWYASCCDGTWEHGFGLRIETIDNPGWRIDIDLRGTPLFRQPYDELSIDRSGADWLRCRVRNDRFEGFGGPGNLKELIDRFLAWATQQAQN